MLNVAIPNLLQGERSGSYILHNRGYYRVRMFLQIRDRIIEIGSGGAGVICRKAYVYASLVGRHYGSSAFDSGPVG